MFTTTVRYKYIFPLNTIAFQRAEVNMDLESSETDNSEDEIDCEESSSDEENAVISESEEEDNINVPAPTAAFAYKAKNGEEWNPVALTSGAQGRQRRENILRQQPGPSRAIIQTATTPKGALRSFLTDEILNIIVVHTNEEGSRRRGNLWRETSKEELEMYVGLLLLAGVYRARFEPTRNLWSAEHGRPFFAKTMSQRRFQELTSFLRFDCKDDRPQRRQRDKLAPIRSICDKIASKFRANYKGGADFCIDEQLLAFRGRCPFKVYMPAKPSKYGVKIWIAADVETSYCLNFQVYTGKEGRLPEVGQGTRVVVELSDFMNGSGRNCTADNFFSSLTLSRTLLSRGMTFIGTIRKNKPFLPSAITNIQGRETLTSKFAFQKGCTLVSYIPKKGKNVILMSSLHEQNEIEESHDDKKPAIILEYNRTKGAVDNLDKIVRTYSVVRKSRRWPMALFGNLVDMAAYNAYVVFQAIWPDHNRNKSHRRRLFLHSLGMEMISGSVNHRTPLTTVPISTSEEETKKRGRCAFCPRNIDKKTFDTCSVCGKNVCSGHARRACYSCIP
jgi:hypothetical protein